MKLSELKTKLQQTDKVFFKLPNGELVPEHFHVTEVGKVNKQFIDCGGKLRKEEMVSLQLWSANDYNHRLHPEKLLHILKLSENKLELNDVEIEVEYQADTIGKYGIDFNGKQFLLTTTQTDCLAKDNCGIPDKKPKIEISTLQTTNTADCNLSSGCC